MHLTHRSLKCAASALALLLTTVLLFATPATAQFRGQLYVSGLTHPVAFVQDPGNAAVQFVVEKEGTIRVVQGGTLLSTPFLDLSGTVATGGERGLLSLAFPPGAIESGRFFITFVNTDGHTVVSRFSRSAGDPLVADPATRFDLRWSTGERFISHPESLHYGGNLVFGAEGYLYIGTGDGGEPNDASHQAQDMTKLHGKLLRIDVNVDGSDPEGLDVPPDNPFVGGGAAPEIWSIGLRNPWRFSLDDPRRGGTGALLIADVGENAIEEVNYLPSGRPARNFGWRNREGTSTNDASLPPAFEPLTDPIFEYGHDFGRSITGGFVYRGARVPSMTGRYVFGDFVRGRVWSLAIATDPATGEATASDLREHTADIAAGASLRTISSFGVDAAGELYVVNYGDGTIVSLLGGQAPAPMIRIESPGAGAVVRQPFALAGWALDASAPDAGIATLHVWAFPASGAPPQFLGVANHGGNRPDVAAIFGPQFGPTAYHINIAGLAPGSWTIAVYGWVNAMHGFGTVATVPVVIEPSSLVTIDIPGNFSTLDSSFVIGGWAIDHAAPSGTGIDTIHIWAYPADGAPPVFLGVPSFGDRPDVTAAFGSQFYGAGYGLAVTTLPAGPWYIVVYAHSSVSGLFDAVAVVFVTVR
jgi:glucose/arabinose dehydrogenase